MVKSVSKPPCRLATFQPKGVEASHVRRRKHALVRDFDIPDDLVAGSLTLTYRKCGKSNCRCASSRGHPLWTLTYSIAGNKNVMAVPQEWLRWLRPLVDAGRRYRQAVAEVAALNAQLLSLWRRQQGRGMPPRKVRPQKRR